MKRKSIKQKPPVSKLSLNIAKVQQRIKTAAERVGRNADEITLVAVTKTHPLELHLEAYNAGLRHFGENRVHEIETKIPAFADLIDGYEFDPAIWHFIGHIQSRQVATVLTSQPDILHALDSVKLAQRIERIMVREGHRHALSVLLQCNVSGEASKSGFPLYNWQEDETQLDTFVAQVEQILDLPHIMIAGLMTMAPYSDNPEDARPVFQSLVELQEHLQWLLSTVNWHDLSMGMTSDFEVAIEEGATIVRVGRALFGERT
ncbi:YggS family pyridoxal phosphate-dependent enzyme [Anaerolineales bacterium HSG6]|nr:YggS family pyridoxal phosphate-dependent enzyme [Anaerolineales bacterium HSG6]MDM8530141.1 YggS family pyridoxal phosphate-dependent enzyme [Anaerolineales bacterium HSG25]